MMNKVKGGVRLNHNLLLEVKQLNNMICQKIFETNKNNILSKHPSPLQMRVIKYLMNHKEDIIYQKDIQESIDISKAAISDVLKSMEKKGIIERVPSKIDGRKIRILLTKEGISIYNEIDHDMKKMNKRIETSITKEELEEFIRISHKIKENLMKEGTQ